MSEFDKMLKKEVNKLVDQRMNAQNLISKVDDLEDQCHDLENGIAGLEDQVTELDHMVDAVKNNIFEIVENKSTNNSSLSYYKDVINVFIKELIELRKKL